MYVCRLERVKLKGIRSVAKVVGTMVTFGGAVVMAVYKGPGFNIFHNNSNSSSSESHHHEDATMNNNHQTIGALYILMGGVALSAFYILQVYICISFFNSFILIYELN